MTGPNPRRDAFAILRRVEEGGAYASVLLEAATRAYADPRDSGLLNEIVLGVLRQRAVLDRAVLATSRRPLETIDPPVVAALRVGAYSLLFLDRVPDFASVDSAVTLAKESGCAKAAGFVNGVLRTIARDPEAHRPAVPAEGDIPGLALALSHPVWWTSRLVARLGWQKAAALLAADNEPARTTLAAWPDAGSRKALAERLAGEGIETTPCAFAEGGLRVRQGAPQRTQAFRDGAFWIQDEASQLAAGLFGPRVGPRVLDLCAAPGGKSVALLTRMAEGGVLVSADRHVKKLGRLTQTLRRLAAREVITIGLDAVHAQDALSGTFDDVLVDAPCSGTGTLRRHPEIRWRLREGDLPAHAERQGRILDGAAPLVAGGGALVYSVCSMEPEEGEGVVAAFLERHPGFRREDPVVSEAARNLVGTDQAVRTSPLDDGMDGFFAVRLRREDSRGRRL